MKLIILYLSLFVVLGKISHACCMVPRTYQGTIGQSKQEAVVVHADGRQELVLGINYKLKPGKDGKLPPYFAWVITVPNEPDHYQLADRDIFRKVFDWGDPKMRVQTRDKSAREEPGRSANGIILSKQIKVGPYTIQPVKATGVEALKGLNDWLEKNGFPKEDEKHMEYFVKNGFTFLCIKINPSEAGASVPGAGPLKPLHLSFKTKEPYYPLRFSSRQGVFGINVWMLTKEKIDPKKAWAVYNKLNAQSPMNNKGVVNPFSKFNVPVKKSNFPKSLVKVVENGQSTAIKEQKQWHLNLIRSSSVNNSRSRIAQWNEDVFVPLAGLTKE
jgi:hypothetical protein